MKDRNIVVLNRIVKYANQISETISRFDLDFSKFENDYVMKNAISMCLLQPKFLLGLSTYIFHGKKAVFCMLIFIVCTKMCTYKEK